MERDRDRRVLIVEDETRLLNFLSLLLENSGFEVEGATDGPSAIELLEQTPFGVAIIDKNLSMEMNGLDVLRCARELQPHLQGLIHTGYPSTDSAVEALKMGAFDYIKKPTDNAMLVAQVERAWLAYELRVSREELFRSYETLFELVPGIVWFTTDHGVFRRVSRKGAALLEYEPGDLIGQRYNYVVDPSANTEDIQWAFMERRTAERMPTRHLVTLRTKSGQKRIFEISSCASYSDTESEKDKKYQGTLAVGWDVTENLRLFEQLLQARQMDALGRLAGGIAHDFNSLLTVIINSVELAEGADEDEAAEHFQSIKEAANSAAEMTRSLLGFSRNGEGSWRKTDVGDVVAKVTQQLPKILADNVHVEVVVEPDLWHAIGDEVQVQQAIVNLVLNARDAMPDGGPINVRAYNQVAQRDAGGSPGEYVIIHVDDKGVGMSRDVRERAFDPFFTTKALGEGTGLGLAMVRGVAQRVGGHVEIDSVVGQGTSVRVYLPRFRSNAIATEPSTLDVGEGEATILLVEDNKLLRSVASRILKTAGFAVAEAADTESALRVWQQVGNVDALLTDVIMSGRSGLELADELRARAPQLPIVFMSGNIGSLEHTMKPRDERTAFVQKPFKADELIKEVRRVLGQRST